MKLNIAILKILGAFLSLFSFTMIPPVIVGLIYQDSEISPYLIGFAVTLAVGLLLWLPTMRIKTELRTRDGFLVVILFWVVLSFFAAIPFVIATHPHVSFINALFESVAGFTTTGANVLPELDHMSHAILYYRQQLQFIGGMGIVVLAVAILPMLGMGGMQLYRAETPGPLKDDKLTPRIMSTAKAVWMLYLGLCLICFIAYWIAGMNVFDALCESFTTVSTGGFSVHDASFYYYSQPAIKIICIIFMALGGINFSLHYSAIVQRKPLNYWRSIEFRTYLYILIIVSIITSIVLISYGYYPTVGNDIMSAIFNTVSFVTTTGFTNGNYALWPSFVPLLLVLLAIVGACAGSTTGGLKLLRVILLQKQAWREVKKMIHPNAIYRIKIDKTILSDDVIESIWGFIAAYFIMFFFIMILIMATNIDFESAFGATVASVANLGVGLGRYAGNFDSFNTFAKSVMIFGMIAGRLEVFTLLVIFSRAFWRK
ncbi:MAG: potassium transporter [Legionellaceae bacterium]|nr:potassium transporter [Legionellaceae bacterium]